MGVTVIIQCFTKIHANPICHQEPRDRDGGGLFHHPVRLHRPLPDPRPTHPGDSRSRDPGRNHMAGSQSSRGGAGDHRGAGGTAQECGRVGGDEERELSEQGARDHEVSDGNGSGYRLAQGLQQTEPGAPVPFGRGGAGDQAHRD